MASAASDGTLRQIERLFGEGTVAGFCDGQLLERFAAGRDEAAFAALVARHGPMVLGVCRGVLKDEHSAEDAFQATFLTLARKAAKLRVRDLKGAATLALTLGAVVAIGMMAMSAGRNDPDPEPPPKNPPIVSAGSAPVTGAGQATPREPTKPESNPDELVEFRGMVLDPHGKAFAGAALLLEDFSEGVTVFNGGIVSPRRFRARSGPDGRFRFAVARSEFPGGKRDDAWRRVPVVASAQGFGPGWGALDELEPGAELSLRLVADDVPVVGRVRDLQGRPIANATVKVDRIEAPIAGDLSPFLDAWKRGDGGAWELLDKNLSDAPAAGLPVALRTDAEGRFRLSGIGRERTLRLRIRAPDIEETILNVLTRADVDMKALAAAGPESEMRNGKLSRPGPPLYGPVCDVLVNPGRTLGGTIREQGTGRVLAGVRLHGSGEGEGHFQDVEAVSDDQGRYRLPGLPVAAIVQLTAYHGGHLPALKYAPAGAGPAPSTVDFDLARGVVVRGRVTEPTTGKPVSGIVVYQPLAGNTFYRDNPSGAWFARVRSGDPIQEDGTYEALVGPGPGAILVQAQDHPRRTGGPTPRYLPARRRPNDGAPGSGGQDDDMLTDAEGHVIFLPLYQAFGVIDPRPGGEPVSCDIQVVPARTRPGTVVGPDGRPLSGAMVAGLLGRFDGPRNLATADFTAEALDPSRPHYLLARHDGRKLAGACIASGEEAEPIALKLEPWGTVTGRLLDADGLPLEGVQVHVYYRGEKGKFMINDSGQLSGPRIATGRDGRFRVEVLIPGLTASLFLVKNGDRLAAGEPLENLTLRPGEIRDLGELSARSTPTP